MERSFYLDLAAQGLRMPIGVDLILNERPDAEARKLDGTRLGEVIVEAAGRFRTPLAFPLMDLRIEKHWLLQGWGLKEDLIDGFLLPPVPGSGDLDRLEKAVQGDPTPRMKASTGAIAHVSQNGSLLPVGMCIGPFSLMTKLLPDPIMAVYQFGMDPDEEESRALTRLLGIGTRTIMRWIEMQIEAGAKAVCICEPAFNNVYLSPRQYRSNPSLIENLVICFHRRIKEMLDRFGVDLIFHDCGEMGSEIIESLRVLDPAILSLGSPCDLPSITPLVDKRTVLFGNLPTKKFSSDHDLSEEQVRHATRHLLDGMKETGHPFILGSECDVLSVPGAAERIMNKVMAMLEA